MAEQKMTVKLDPGQMEALKQFVREQIRIERERNFRVTSPGAGFRLQDIVEGDGLSMRVLHLSDGCNHVQWMSGFDLGTGLDSVPCTSCDDGGARHTWRKVWVKA